MSWWVITRYSEIPTSTTLRIECTTDKTAHMYMAWATWKPTRTPIYRTRRGVRVICGYKYIWDTPTITEQDEWWYSYPHTFNLSDLEPGSTIWFYLYSLEGPFENEVQGPLMYVTLPFGPPPPSPIAAPIFFTVADDVIRCGNHYTFWANGEWYVMVPTASTLTMWKRELGAMVRLDQAHEPGPPSGTIEDGDARLASDEMHIHCAYFNAVAAPGPHRLYYDVFNCNTDTWGTQSLICNPTQTSWHAWCCCLELSPEDVVNVLYSDYTLAFPEVHHRYKTDGGWSMPSVAVAVPYRAFYSMTFCLRPSDGRLCALAPSTTYQHWYNATTPPDYVWLDLVQLDNAANLPQHTLDSYYDEIHVGQTQTTNRLSHWYGDPPTHQEANLTLASSNMANILSGPPPDHPQALVYRDHNADVAQIYRSPGGPWGAETQIVEETATIITATLAEPDVISCLWRSGGLEPLGFYAWWAPWHT